MTGSTRTIWIMALTAVVSLALGLGLSRLIVSPADAAASAAAPEAGPITVPVERRTLANDVVLRGDAIYEDPASVTVEVGDIGGPAVVTGQVPEVGATIEAGQVMLEITGRPVILLPGELPVYRTLRPGVSGPDVLQLKTALNALGIPMGDPLSPAYDDATAAAIVELYARVGYPAPTASEEALAAVDAARDQVRAAEEQVAAAQRELATAGAGSPASERIQLQAAVNSAQAALDEARAACAPLPPVAEGEDPPVSMCSQQAIVSAQGELDIAVARRQEGSAGPDTSAQRAAVTAAQRGLTEAREDLAKAQRDVVTPLPASEVVYLTTTPRRVDSVAVKRGSAVAGTSVMSVSGATLQIAGTVSPSDAELIAEGSVATITLPGGDEVPGTVQSVGAPPPAGTTGQPGDDDDADTARKRVVVVPDALTEEQRAELQGANVRMTIPVSSTEGEVLAVPTAALTAGPGGEARVEVLADDGESTLVTVETGLAAGGFVEVSALEGTLEEGDRVVVGAAPQEEEAEPSEEPGEESTDEGSGEG